MKKFKEAIKKEANIDKALKEMQSKSRYLFACSVADRRVFRVDSRTTLTDMYATDYVIVTDDMTYLLEASVPEVTLKEMITAMEKALLFQPITHRDMVHIGGMSGSWHTHLSKLIKSKSVAIREVK